MSKKTEVENFKKFEQNYIKYVQSRNGVGSIVTGANLIFRLILVLITLGIIFAIYGITYRVTIPDVFIYPLMLVVFIIFTVPFTIYFVKGIIARLRFNKLKIMVKKLSYERKQKAYLVHSKMKFHTFLVFNDSYPHAKCLAEVEAVEKIYQELGRSQTFNKVYDKVQSMDLKGELKITDFYSKKIYTIKNEEYKFPTVQAYSRSKDLRSKPVSGLSVGHNFILFPPSVWNNSNVTNKKII